MKECYTNIHRTVQRFATLQLSLPITPYSTTHGPCLATCHKSKVIIVQASYHYCMFQGHPLSSFYHKFIILGMWSRAKNYERIMSEDDTLSDDKSNLIIHCLHEWFIESWRNEKCVQENDTHIRNVKWFLCAWYFSSSSSSSSVGPVANATDVLQPSRLIVLTLSPLLFGCSHVCRQVPPRPQRRERS